MNTEKLFVVPRKGTKPPYICKAVYKTPEPPQYAAFRAALAAELDALERRELRGRIAEAAAAAPMITDAYLQEWEAKYLW
jgi:hypothetical protein